MLLGCIADDFTGATDLANMLVRGGMRTIQTIGVPAAPLGEEVDAVVVALKSRTIPAPEAVAQSLAALAWLQQAGCQADLLQVLLHLRLDAEGQHRPGHRRADGRAGDGFHHRLPGVSRGRPHHLPRLPVRRRRAAVRVRHEGPSAHADDGCQPRARAAGADQAQGRARPLRHAGARCRSAARADRGAASGGSRHRHRRCAVRGRSHIASPRAAPTCRW